MLLIFFLVLTNRCCISYPTNAFSPASYFVCRMFFFFLLSLAGLSESNCSILPKHLYVEVGSSVEIMCQCWRVRGKIFWTLNAILLDESLSKTINSSHTLLSLAHIAGPMALTLECHSSDMQQILAGTIIKTYSKKYFWYLLAALDGYADLFSVVFTAKPTQLSCTLHQTTEDLAGLFTCSWEHQNNSSKPIFYSVMWWDLYCSLCEIKFLFILVYTTIYAFVFWVFFSLSCTTVTEICRSIQTSCRANFTSLNEVHLKGHYNFTVRAKSTFWEAFSDPYEITPLKIRK